MIGQVAQLAGSLAAILAVAWLVRKMELGGDARIRDEADVRRLAEEALCGFEPVDYAIDRAGQAALMCDAAGRWLVLRRHGAHFVSRLLDAGATARHEGDVLIVDPGDRRFGPVRLDLGADAATWAARLERL